MRGMGAIRNQGRACTLVAMFCLVSFGCETSADRLDLRSNPLLYRSPGYEAAAAVDRGAFIAPLADVRSTAPVEASGPFPVAYVSEGIWDAPVPQMIGDILREEFEKSGVFAELRDIPGPDTLIVTPHLLSAFCGQEEQIAGRRSVGEVALRIVVHGPGESPETRTKIFDRTFPESAATPVTMLPPEPTFTIGIALRKSIQRTLQALDQSNVARSAVPIDPEFAGTAVRGAAGGEKN